MWVTDYFMTERLRLASDARRGAGEGKSAHGWRWRIEPGMEEAFEDLQGWLLSSQQEVPAEMTAPSQGAARLEEAAYLGGSYQGLLPVGSPVPARCRLDKRHWIPDTGLAVTRAGVSCCAP
jgi:hypothetical protein